ncbi:MAG: hypothetical protein IPP51_01835 [Bacteroidetes bacterium]|nr:hypothetical protein [Bacteroidota bacterium]
MEENIRSRSLILAVGVHAGLFLILLFTVMRTTIPPFPEAAGGNGTLISIGTVDEASGDIQPMSSETAQPVNAVKVETTAPEEEIATQETEESPIVHEKKDPTKVQPKKTRPDVKTNPKPIEKPRTVNSAALYHGSNNNSTSQGNGSGQGDQGKPDGDPKGLYSGAPGSGGDGSSPGSGGGPGGDGGKGVSFSLTGRRIMQLPTISDRSQETGKVVVDITVSKDGKVETAIPGGRGSTTTSSYLFKLAKDAAMKTKFNVSPDKADIQKGTITFVFRVQ